VLIEPRTPADPDLRELLVDQQREIAGLEGDGHVSFPLHEGIEFIVGLLDGQAVACGALQTLEPGVGEVKRMYVRPPYRGQGLSRQILNAIEGLAARRGLHTLRLETGRFLAPALGLYTSSGYAEIPLYGQYRGHATSVCFSKSV